MHAFRAYDSEAQREISRWQTNFEGLSYRHKSMLPSMLEKFENARARIETNQSFFKSMMATFDPGENPVEYLKGAKEAGDEAEAVAGGGRPSFADVDKASGLHRWELWV